MRGQGARLGFNSLKECGISQLTVSILGVFYETNE